MYELEDTTNQLCPDVDFYTLNGGTRNKEGDGLIFRVDAKDGVDQEWINDSIVYTSMINRYFDPVVYLENGYMPWITVTEDEFDLKYKNTVRQELYITRNDISFYNFRYLDTSQIATPDLSQKFVDYKTLDSAIATFRDYTNTKVFYLRIVQAREYTEIIWSIQSIDLILGLVGGFVGVIWTGLALLVGPYEEFKFQTSLVGSVYPVSP